MSAPPPKKPALMGAASAAAAAPVAAAAAPAVRAPPTLATLLAGAGRRIADFLPFDDGAALAQASKGMHAAVQQVQGAAPTGRALVGAAPLPLHTLDPPGGDRFYHPMTLSGAQAPFPHITRRANPAHVPHVTDVQPARHAAMPDGLAAGTYPTRFRYDIQNGTLAAPITPTTNAERRTATLTPFVGAPPDTFVMPRYKARAEELAAAAALPAIAAPAAGAAAGGALLPPVAAAARPTPAPLPALATPVRLSPSQSGAAAAGPPLTGAAVRFQSKL